MASMNPYNTHKWVVKFQPIAGAKGSLGSIPLWYLVATLSSHLRHMSLPCCFIRLLHLCCCRRCLLYPS